MAIGTELLVAACKEAFSFVRRSIESRIKDRDEKENDDLKKKLSDLKSAEGDQRRIAETETKLKQSRGVSVQGSPEEICAGLLRHGETARSWSDRISFKDLNRSREVASTYTPLDIHVYPRRQRDDPTQKIAREKFSILYQGEDKHVVVLGPAGAGKTTSMQYIFRRVRDETPVNLVFPIVFVWREILADTEAVKAAQSGAFVGGLLSKILGLRIQPSGRFELEGYESEAAELRAEYVFSLINSLKCLLIFDGFDEIPDREARRGILRELQKYSNLLPTTRIILTSRTGDFDTNFVTFRTFEIAPLDERQVREFAEKYLVEKADKFLAQLGSTPFADSAFRPITLAHLCAIFDRTGSIPERPKTVYRMVVRLHLEEWDFQRSVQRISAYAKLDIDGRAALLSSLAYRLTTDLKTTRFNAQQLAHCCRIISGSFQIPDKDIVRIVAELEEHTGLFLQASMDTYEFAHKSLQEYLTADYIVRLPTLIKDRLLLGLLPSECAIACCLSYQPAEYFAQLVFEALLPSNVERDFYRVFIDRLVIEKPEFEPNDGLILAIVTLSSLFVFGGKPTSTKNPRLKDAREASAIEGLIGLCGGRAVLSKISDYYDHEPSIGAQAEFAFFTRRRAPGRWRLPFRLAIPTEFTADRKYPSPPIKPVKADEATKRSYVF